MWEMVCSAYLLHASADPRRSGLNMTAETFVDVPPSPWLGWDIDSNGCDGQKGSNNEPDTFFTPKANI
jgi:hypothetical protein